MFSIGLTGGIGSGKSAVADLLVDEPLLERFGTDILAVDRSIDRQALADVAFASPEALADLNAITHPVIGIEMIERQRALAETDALVILAIPLLRAIHRETMVIDRVVVVDCPTEVAVDRLVTYRAFPEGDARARIAAQITREERTAEADYVLLNDAGLDELAAAVERLWDWIAAVRPGG